MKKPCILCGTIFYENPAKTRYCLTKGWLNAGKFCSKVCSGKNRRINRTEAEKKEIKRLYDIEYRKRTGESRKKAKKAYFLANREKILNQMRLRRATPEYKERMKKYLSTYWNPKKKELKSDYDRKRRCNLKWDNPDLAEAEYYLLGIEDQVFKKMEKYERLLARGYYKRQIERVRNAKVKRGYA